MFHPAATLPVAGAHFLALFLGAQALGGRTPLHVGGTAAAGAATVALFWLLLRVYDELKDAEHDVRLGTAGDPRYKDRPIVTGLVTLDDIRWLRSAVLVTLVAVNLPLGFPLPLTVFAACMLLVWLSSRWYFWPAIAGNLLLAFLTHNPLALAIGAYAVAVAAAGSDLALPAGPVTLLVVSLWLPAAAWETSRKVRVPEDETEYATYSKVLGWRTAALVPAAFVLASAAGLVGVAAEADLGGGFAAVVLAATALPVGRCLLFRLSPNRRRANLRPWVEIFGGVANAALATALVARHGLTLP